ncbi:MAG: dienelactone hydrolase family protein [Acidimicrobiia bacterium]
MAVLPHEGTYSVMYGGLPISVGTGYRPGYLARPDKSGRFPVVILVPDIDGVTAHEKHLARRIARRGVAVIAVDLYANDRTGDALETYHDLDDGEAVRVLDEVQEYLSSEDIEWAHAARVGVLGLEVGGRFALIQAAHRPWVASAAVAYAPLTGDEERRYQVADMLDHLAPPILAIYGAEDDLVDPDTVDEAQNRNASGSWLLYEGVGHGFLDDGGPTYDQGSAEDAIQRLVDFFLATLPKASVQEVG